MQDLHVTPVALDLAWDDPAENIRRIEAAVDERLKAAPQIPSDAQLFLFPELTLTGFVTKDPGAFRLAPPDAPVEALSGLARRRKTAIAAGFPENGGGRPFNALALFGPDGSLVARYRKLHLFTAGKTPESSAYAAGDEGVVARYRGWRIGLSICFDLRFPGLYHAYARAGADLVLAASCWLSGPHKAEQYRALGAAHAILGQCYLASVNRSGKDPSYEYEGAEYVFSPFGEQLYHGEPARLDPAELELCRRMAVRVGDRETYPVRTR